MHSSLFRCDCCRKSEETARLPREWLELEMFRGNARQRGHICRACFDSVRRALESTHQSENVGPLGFAYWMLQIQSKIDSLGFAVDAGFERPGE